MIPNGRPPPPQSHLGRERRQEEQPKRRKIADTVMVSLLEAFFPEEIHTHIASCRIPRDKPRLDTILEDADNEQLKSCGPGMDNTCHICEQDGLKFDPLPLFCTVCGVPIIKGVVYWHFDNCLPELRPTFCNKCYNKAKKVVTLDPYQKILKSELQKKTHEEDVDEPRVQCVSCKAWVHNLCGLFNKGTNEEELPYNCPHCLLVELSDSKRKPITNRPQCFLEAKDLPRTELSDFMEMRMQRAMDEDRRHRAAMQGRRVEDVPPVPEITIRVINSVNKKAEVKKNFFEHYGGGSAAGGGGGGYEYPTEFTFKQKVILLFQKIEGVDVCLYCMYTQEYGSENKPPNARTCYLSYIDSVKYFRPEREESSVKGLPLRSFVYREILLGYIEYIKLRGFNEMFIWSCPPMQGDDYIFFCHPSHQKNPKSDRLREWYLDILKKGQAEGIISHCTNMYDKYFDGGREHRLEKVSMSSIPYYEGDYWTGEAENLLVKIGKEATKDQGKKGSSKQQPLSSKRRAGGTSTDEQLMGKLSEEARKKGIREDFIVVHLRPCCSFCRKYHGAAPTSGPAWFCPKQLPPGASKSANTVQAKQQREAFSLCNECYNAEELRLQFNAQLPVHMAGSNSIPSSITLWDLVGKPVEMLPETADRDKDMECEIFETRASFVSLCQGNHYQYNSLRHAKHSTMMVLYHLHNPSRPDEPAFASNCNSCGKEIEPGRGWRCSVCTDFDQCELCYETRGHAHPRHLVHSRQQGSERTRRISEEEVLARQHLLNRSLTLLKHSVVCNQPCASNSCKKLKEYLQHITRCPQRSTGTCGTCKKLVELIHAHARQCVAGICPVPLCNQLREARRMALQRQEQKRRTAYTNMMIQNR